jgi:hypothetical protein
MDINEIFKLALPLLSAVLSYMFQQLHYSNKTNTIIAGSFVLLSSACSAIIQGQITGNVYADVLIIASTSVALQAESFTPLQQYLRGNFSPVLPFKKKSENTQELKIDN